MHHSFEYNLVKGRIAETIFELMFRDTGKFTVLHFGYESTMPMLAQYRNTVMLKKVLDQVDKSPDFVLMTEDKTQAYFVEVKYRARPDKEEILKTASEIAKRWEVCHLFMVTPDGFYMSPIQAVIKNGGVLERLPESWVAMDIQEKYMKLAEDFYGRID